MADIRAIKAAGYKLGDEVTDANANECFRRSILFFAQTQSGIGWLFIELERKRLELSKQIKQLRSDRSPALQRALELQEAIINRQAILTRLMDSIVRIVFPEGWQALTIHLSFQRSGCRPGPDELLRVLAVAWGQNQESDREIHIVSDLTNIVQMGDIIRIRWDAEGVYVRLQEVKTGEMNDKLGDLIDSGGGTLSITDLDEIESKFGLHAREQASRMVRQRDKFREFDVIWQLHATADPFEKKLFEVLAVEELKPMPTYLSLLPDLVADARDRGMSVHGIDGCFWLIALAEKGRARLGELKNLHHWLFHLKYPQLECRIEEIEALNRQPPLINLTAHNMNYLRTRSPLMWYPKDLVLDVVMDRISIYAQFDLDAFLEIASKRNLKLAFVTGKEGEETRRTKASTPMLGKQRAYGVKVKFSNGRELKLPSAFLQLVYSELVDPTGILDFIASLDAIQQRI